MEIIPKSFNEMNNKIMHISMNHINQNTLATEYITVLDGLPLQDRHSPVCVLFFPLYLPYLKACWPCTEHNEHRMLAFINIRCLSLSSAAIKQGARNRLACGHSGNRCGHGC